MTKKCEVHSSVKDERLVQIRREQMIKAAITLFKEKGFHRTTTREIARNSGFSIGTLYEYIRSKEDILYLVCDQIHGEVQGKIQRVLKPKEVTLESVKESIAAYFRIMDEMQDEVLVLYQEAKSLSKEMLPYILKKELQMVAIFEELIKQYIYTNDRYLGDKEIQLLAHNIFVQGQMWGFRRWVLQKNFSLEEYTNIQTRNFIKGLKALSVSSVEKVE